MIDLFEESSKEGKVINTDNSKLNEIDSLNQNEVDVDDQDSTNIEEVKVNVKGNEFDRVQREREEVQSRLANCEFIKVKHVFCFNGFSIDLGKRSAFNYVFNIFLSQIYDENFMATHPDTFFIVVS